MPREDASAELEEAETALSNDAFDTAREKARSFRQAEDDATRFRAKRITGLAYYHEGKHERAVPLLREVAEAEDTTNAWFNLASAATRAGRPEVGAEAFERARELNDSDHLSLAKLHYHYAKALRDAGEYDRALEPLGRLREAYAQTGIMDSTFLSMRGIPFLGRTLDVVVDVFVGLDRGDQGRAWMDELASEVDDTGTEIIEEHKQQLP